MGARGTPSHLGPHPGGQVPFRALPGSGWIEAVSPSGLQNKVTQGSGLLPGPPLVWEEGSGASAKGCCLYDDTNESQCHFEFSFPNYSAVKVPFSARLGWGLGVGSGGFGEACGPRPAKDQATSPSWLLNS